MTLIGGQKNIPCHLKLRDRCEQRFHPHTSVEDEIAKADKAAPVGLKEVRNKGQGTCCSILYNLGDLKNKYFRDIGPHYL